MDNYEIISKRNIPEYSGIALQLLHKQSRASVVVLQNNDRENFFCFGFLTPPSNHYGTAHILEHVVLCGSKNYPVRDPFLTMLKGSMQTFLNAMTYPDRTLYPAASPVEKDFFNLMSVYGDAVFFPLIREEAFLQEGYSLEIKKQKLVPGGVVFNEMKGVYSSHDSFASDAVIRSLFPQTSYRFDAGGNPHFIPNISLEELKKFHKDYYSGHNARIFLYGDVNLEKKLDFLHEKFLSKFEARSNDTPYFTVTEPDFSEKIAHGEYFPAPPGSSLLSTVGINWRFPPIKNQEDVLDYEMISRLLLGSCGAPLYYALESSHLGQGLSSISGIGFDYHYPVFSAALQKVEPKNEKKVESIVHETLRKIVESGFDSQDVKAALSSVEFGRREIGGGPVGLHLAKRLYKVWMSQNCDPLEVFGFDDLFNRSTEKILTRGYFEDFIEKQLIENVNNSVVIVKPKLLVFKKEKQEEKNDLKTMYSQMSLQDKANLKACNLRVKHYQKEKDPQGILPVLTRSDIPKKIVKIPHDITVFQDVPVISLEGNTRGVHCWKYSFNLSNFSYDDLIYFPLLCRCLSRVGWENVSYDRASLEIMRCASCLIFHLDNSMDVQGNLSAHLVVTVKALKHQCETALDIMMKVILKANYDVQERIREIVLELLNDLRTDVIHNGTSFVMHSLAKNFSISGVLDDLWFGVKQLLFLDKINQGLENEDFIKNLISILSRMHHKVFSKENLTISFATDQKNFGYVRSETMFRLENFPQSNISENDRNFGKSLFLGERVNQGYYIASQVNYVGFAVDCLGKYGTACASHERLLANYLSLGPLWEMVRMKGGAYGVRAALFSLDGAFIMTSYRDPHVEQTMGIFSNVFKLIKKVARKDFDQALIGLVGREIRPLSVEEMLSTVTRWYFLGIEDKIRQQNLDDLISCGPNDLALSCEGLQTKISSGISVTLGEQTQIIKAQEHGFFAKVESLS